MHPLVGIAARLRDEVDALSFAEPVSVVYNPLSYAFAPHCAYLEKFGSPNKEAVLLGMNPGPYGMAQTGVPFGEIKAVTEWMKIKADVLSPPVCHPKRPILGFSCTRSEVSGARLWGLLRSLFSTPSKLSKKCIVLNYCPLVFMEQSGKNRTPDKLPKAEKEPLFAACDRALLDAIEYLQPKMVVGVGVFAETRAKAILGDDGPEINRILHPSPASPVANRGFEQRARAELAAMGLSWGG